LPIAVHLKLQLLVIPTEFCNKQDRQVTYQRNNEARLRNHCCRGKAANVTYSNCMCVTLRIQHAVRMQAVL